MIIAAQDTGKEKGTWHVRTLEGRALCFSSRTSSGRGSSLASGSCVFFGGGSKAALPSLVPAHSAYLTEALEVPPSYQASNSIKSPSRVSSASLFP